ncbi:MAG: flavin monoamine oxidase family protein [Nocardioides sp.]|uniref:flavin monoamine oxidase family protein n=1 Tax=Nocardioides sp. TaxID=35761 RepID=UPI003F0BC8DC
MNQYDVIVIGAGFAGATAARECASRGLRTLVLEARDRTGGRSGSTTLSDGTVADIGGTFVNWTQPHVWAEISRYGLTDHVVPGTVAPQWMVTRRGGELVWDDYAPVAAFERACFEKVVHLSAEVFPNLANPLQNLEAVRAADQLTVAEALEQMDLTDHERMFLGRSLSAYASLPPEEASWSGVLRWFAMGQGDYDEFMTMLMTYKLKCGTGELLDRILADGGAELRLNSPVRAVTSGADGVEVTLADGEVCRARSVVVAVPSGVWQDLDLTPPLAPAQLDASREGMQATWSGKAVAVIRGETRPLFFRGDASLPFSFFTQSVTGPDEQIVAFYPGSETLDISDPDVVRNAIEEALPYVTVVDCAGDTYLPQDPSLRGAWAFLRPGQLTKYRPHEEFTRLDERVVFATSDIARLFHSFIDGAIESGLRAAGEVRTLLSPRTPAR